MYILETKGQYKGVEVIVQCRELTKTAVVSKKIEHKPRASKAVWAGAIILVDTSEIWGNLVCLQVEFTGGLEIYEGVPT